MAFGSGSGRAGALADAFLPSPMQADVMVDANQPFQGFVSKCLAAIEAWR